MSKQPNQRPHQRLQLTRRLFLQGSAAAGTGLIIGFQLSCGGRQSGPKPAPDIPTSPGTEFQANAFLRIGSDNSVTVLSRHIEFGQGSYTGIATLVAEELGVDWKQVRVESAPANGALYANPAFGIQGTGGSTAMATCWQPMREAGAKARMMLLAAAAAEWQVPVSELVAADGHVTHQGSGRAAGFGDLVDRASKMTEPDKVTLKDPKDFKLVGGHLPRVDTRTKSNGKAVFTIDVYRPDMLTAVLARPPRFGGALKSFDASAAKQVKGVVDVVQVPRGVAVVAKNFWAAKKGRDALRVEWDDSKAEKRSTDQLWSYLRDMMNEPGQSVRREGDATRGLDSAAKVIEAEFTFPFLAQAPMEPLDCVAQIKDGGCELWAGSQLQGGDQMAAAHILGLKPEQVTIHTMLGGGSFGRRATPNSDVASEAVTIAKALGNGKPVKLVWTREDDIRGGRYRPIFLHRMRGGIDRSGNIVAWHHRLAGQSIMKGTPFEAMMQNGVDPTMIEGAANLPYQIANLEVDFQIADIGVPCLWWRSVGHTHNAFATEVFLDQLCRAGGRDPYEVRRALLARHPRHLGVLDLAAKKANWGSPLPGGKARGIAVHESFGSFVAQVAEISLDQNGFPKVERVVCAVDCGVAINPDIIASQMEGGLGYGLSAALFNELNLDGGRVVESNFHDYRSLRIHEMPAVEVHIVPSQTAPTGVGEPGTPPIAPAVANAYLQLTGKPIHRLPFSQALKAQRG